MTAVSGKMLAILALAAAGVAGCNSNSRTGPKYNLQIPTSWVSAGAVSNPFFPLARGTTYEYEGQTDKGLERITVEVLNTTKVVNGVTTTVVRDRVYASGTLIEDTYDWYAQDAVGNVWYLGENSKEIQNGQVVSTDGSWEWGVDGALPGIVMWADPSAHMGEEYRQEFHEGEAEDFAKVIAVGQNVSVRLGNFSGCIVTADRNALESGPVENKSYCPQVGLVQEVNASSAQERVELVTKTPYKLRIPQSLYGRTRMIPTNSPNSSESPCVPGGGAQTPPSTRIAAL